MNFKVLTIICFIFIFLIPICSATQTLIANGTTGLGYGTESFANDYTGFDSNKTNAAYYGNITLLKINMSVGGNIKLLTFYDNGTHYVYRNTSAQYAVSSGIQTISVDFYVGTNEILAVYAYAPALFLVYTAVTSKTESYISGLQESDSAHASWTSVANREMVYEAWGAGDAAPSITSHAPSTPNSSWANVDKDFNFTSDEVGNHTYWMNGNLAQTNTSVTTSTYTNLSVDNKGLSGLQNLTMKVENANGSDTQKIDWTLLENYVITNVTYDNRSNLSYNRIFNIEEITPGVENISIGYGNTDAGNSYGLYFSNGTQIASTQTATSNNETVWFNGTVVVFVVQDNYFINETIGTATSTIIVPTNKLGLFNNWTAATNFSNIAASESNDVCYSYYNVTTGEWESYYPPYSWNADYEVPLEASVFIFVDAETIVTADIITPSNTNLYTGWNMIFVMGTDNETIADIIIDMESSL